MTEGVIKFSLKRTPTILDPCAELEQLITWRNKLFAMKLIGELPDGVGYGNVSVRVGRSSTFLITGTGTGGVKELSPSQVALVRGFDIARNFLNCEGEVDASSESLSHAALYQASASIRGVVHFHSTSLWKNQLHKSPTTPQEAEYGTPQMANALIELIATGEAGEPGLIVMAGHEDGLLAFGISLEEAIAKIQEFL